MEAKIIYAEDREFKSDEGDIVRGVSIVLLDPKTGSTYKHFLGGDDLRGFKPELVCTIKGKLVEVSRDIKTYKGKERVVVDSIREIVE